MSSSSTLRKTEKLTLTTLKPPFIPQHLAISVLHDHSKVITLNPLVTDHVQIPPPNTAAKDEHNNCTWYNIAERIQYVPGLGKIGSGKINFQGCFRNTPDGLWTHIHAPMNVDLKIAYRLASLVGTSSGDLVLKADVQFECNVTLAAFVRMQIKASIKEMVERIVEKAERADAAALLARGVYTATTTRTPSANDPGRPR